jgi:hypothetical protein
MAASRGKSKWDEDHEGGADGLLAHREPAHGAGIQVHPVPVAPLEEMGLSSVDLGIDAVRQIGNEPVHGSVLACHDIVFTYPAIPRSN